MKETLLSLGWTCQPCNCPGAKGVDCAHPDHPRVMISIRSLGKNQNQFRIIKKSLVVDTGLEYQLDDKLISHGLQ
ncbi:hypothetical protein [Segetibacter aerophilus]|uniref:Uncharacterized protein n=1 Tax=Segetibacter aerophilus TaxID=670293 RepID=A0A512B9X3_9BACT|nr:hypothetical protein [Segetibacter aerophilus]GEO08752.1 hypothetical protein SAE01_12480 [Segetibacter aerophilus]